MRMACSGTEFRRGLPSLSQIHVIGAVPAMAGMCLLAMYDDIGKIAVSNPTRKIAPEDSGLRLVQASIRVVSARCTHELCPAAAGDDKDKAVPPAMPLPQEVRHRPHSVDIALAVQVEAGFGLDPAPFEAVQGPAVERVCAKRSVSRGLRLPHGGSRPGVARFAFAFVRGDVSRLVGGGSLSQRSDVPGEFDPGFVLPQLAAIIVPIGRSIAGPRHCICATRASKRSQASRLAIPSFPVAALESLMRLHGAMGMLRFRRASSSDWVTRIRARTSSSRLCGRWPSGRLR